jgi:hypothetical protein
VIGAIVIRTGMLRGVDGASASPGEDEHGRWHPRGLRTRFEALRTGVAQGLMEQSSEGFGCFGAFAPGLLRLEGRLGGGTWMVRPPDMHHEAEQHESSQKKLVKQQV